MKLAMLLPFVLLLGLLIGGWGPKEELRAARKEAAALNKRLADSENKGSRISDFTRMVQIPERAKQAKAAEPPKAMSLSVTVSDGTAPGTTTHGTDAPLTNAAAAQPGAPGKKEPPLSPEDLRARIDEAKELWKTRVEVARAQWVNRLKLDQEQSARFDETVTDMNERLYNTMESLAAALSQTDSLTPEVGTKAFSEMTAALADTYDALHAFVPENLGGEVAKIELTDFIDPTVAEPLIAVQDKIENAPKAGERHRGPRLFR